MTRKGARRKAPSRVRYEQEHPTVSVRVDRKLYERLVAIRDKEGKSFGDVLREAIGIQEREAHRAYQRGLARGQNDGHKRGHAEGYETAKRAYAVRYRCSVCGNWMELSGDNAKAAARECMEERGWGHSRCLG